MAPYYRFDGDAIDQRALATQAPKTAGAAEAGNEERGVTGDRVQGFQEPAKGQLL